METRKKKADKSRLTVVNSNGFDFEEKCWKSEECMAKREKFKMPGVPDACFCSKIPTAKFGQITAENYVNKEINSGEVNFKRKNIALAGSQIPIPQTLTPFTKSTIPPPPLIPTTLQRTLTNPKLKLTTPQSTIVEEKSKTLPRSLNNPKLKPAVVPRQSTVVERNWNTLQRNATNPKLKPTTIPKQSTIVEGKSKAPPLKPTILPEKPTTLSLKQHTTLRTSTMAQGKSTNVEEKSKTLPCKPRTLRQNSENLLEQPTNVSEKSIIPPKKPTSLPRKPNIASQNRDALSQNYLNKSTKPIPNVRTIHQEKPFDIDRGKTASEIKREVERRGTRKEDRFHQVMPGQSESEKAIQAIPPALPSIDQMSPEIVPQETEQTFNETLKIETHAEKRDQYTDTHQPHKIEKFSEFKSSLESKLLAEVHDGPSRKEILVTKISFALSERLKKYPKKLFSVFFTPPGTFDDVEDETWKWEDPLYVRVPLSSKFNKEDNPEARADKHWTLIKIELEKLLEDITNVHLQLDIGDRLRQAIVAYCPDAEMKSDFEILYRADLHIPLKNTLKLIIQYALCLPYLLSSPIPILAQGHSSTLYLTKRLTCSLLANAFLCTIPDPQDNMPDFNFLRLFCSSSEVKSDVKAEKLKCIFNYFAEMSSVMEAAFQGGEEDDDIISFERRCIQQLRDWRSSDKSLINVNIEPQKGIEEAKNMLQVDFANKIVGGGILSDGAVMEEIRFCICPELIVSRLFTAPLDDDEVLVITGTQQYCLYSGYSTTFKYCGSFGEQNDGRDNLGRRFTQVVAMDALHFRQSEISKQFQEPSINRELHKCYVACIHSAKCNTPFATGNWGCGVFNGDPEMKFFIQWLSASEAGRQSLYYHTIGDKDQGDSIEGILRYIKRKQLNVSSLYNLLLEYYEDWDDYDSVFDFVKDKLKSVFKENRSKRSSYAGGEVYIKVKSLR